MLIIFTYEGVQSISLRRFVLPFNQRAVGFVSMNWLQCEDEVRTTMSPTLSLSQLTETPCVFIREATSYLALPTHWSISLHHRSPDCYLVWSLFPLPLALRCNHLASVISSWSSMSSYSTISLCLQMIVPTELWVLLTPGASSRTSCLTNESILTLLSPLASWPLPQYYANLQYLRNNMESPAHLLWLSIFH